MQVQVAFKCPNKLVIPVQTSRHAFRGARLPAASLRQRSGLQHVRRADVVATWTPPSDPSSTPNVPPEFTPPDQRPSVMPGAPPEFVPPEQSPPGPAQPTDPPRPGRIARPEVPDPERDPMRSPDRRREINEPEPDTEPAPLPDRE